MDRSTKFEPVPGMRHAIEMADGLEWIVVKAARSWPTLLFLSFWLFFWTLGGIAAMTAFANGKERGFLSVWLVAWLFGWLFAAATVFWQIWGRTRVGVQAGALVHRWSMPLLTRGKRYDAAQVRNLRATDPPFSTIFAGLGRTPYPPFLSFGGGTLAFDYGARTIKMLPEVDAAEARMIVDWLVQRLPRTAVG